MTTTTTVTATEAQIKAAEEEKNRLIENNYATPLTGTFLNLPNQSALIECPCCGKKEQSVVLVEDQQWAASINNFIKTLFHCLCCCWCLEYKKIVNKTDTNHYCKTCNCFFGRANRVKPIHISS
ncbi:uncharacterized protein LOC142239082 [Haematobia irritans]|uniref:uncharacterized protein LOC142239082 n=1 Tax=Haematobia irritans TaxID=7368 RepID=UPI003F5037B5